jgi:hypothetical protein
LKCVGTRIADNLLYIPFNTHGNWKDTSIDSYIGAANLSIIDKARMKIEYTTPQSHICIYSVTSNTLWYNCDSAGVGFEGPAEIQLWQEIKKNMSKKIYPDKVFCPIRHSKIKEGNTFCECNKCKNCFFLMN